MEKKRIHESDQHEFSFFVFFLNRFTQLSIMLSLLFDAMGSLVLFIDLEIDSFQLRIMFAPPGEYPGTATKRFFLWHVNVDNEEGIPPVGSRGI